MILSRILRYLRYLPSLSIVNAPKGKHHFKQIRSPLCVKNSADAWPGNLDRCFIWGESSPFHFDDHILHQVGATIPRAHMVVISRMSSSGGSDRFPCTARERFTEWGLSPSCLAISLITVMRPLTVTERPRSCSAILTISFLSFFLSENTHFIRDRSRVVAFISSTVTPGKMFLPLSQHE